LSLQPKVYNPTFFMRIHKDMEIGEGGSQKVLGLGVWLAG
jgi:hypothetical protein